jgi:hypothetical protein
MTVCCRKIIDGFNYLIGTKDYINLHTELNRNTVFKKMASDGNICGMKILLKKFDDLDIESALYNSVVQKNYEVVKFLVGEYPEINFSSAYEYACKKEMYSFIEFFIKRGGKTRIAKAICKSPNILSMINRFETKSEVIK